MKTIQQLIDTLPQQGRVLWIGIRSARREPMTVVDAVTATTESGLIGDRYSGRTGNRHVTLLQAEHLPAIAGYLGRKDLDPTLLRRNLVVSGINLLSLKGRHCRIGEVLLEVTGACHPCSRMEELLGEGGYNAVRSHGGLTARVIEGGIMKIGDTVSLELRDSAEGSAEESAEGVQQ